MMNRRQMDVQYRNFAAMCRITVKTLIDYACVNTNVDEDCEEFINFCAVFEQMVSHRIRPYQKKMWQKGSGMPRHFWEVMLENHRQGPLFRTCIPNIAAIESLKSPRAKLRAFVRVALMEKRLSDYLYWMQNNRTLMEECYLDGALFSSEEGSKLIGDIIGLSAIDFNFCLRENENKLLAPYEISYAPFLTHTQSQASRLIDEEEMLHLSGQISDSPVLMKSLSKDKMKLHQIERDFRGVKEQKDYLEELTKLRDRQIGSANLRLEAMKESVQGMETEWRKERNMLDECILELQDEVSVLRDQNNLLKGQISELQLFKTRRDMQDVAMVDLAYMPIMSGSNEGHVVQTAADRPQSVPLLPMQDMTGQLSSDQRSIASGLSADHLIRLKEDSQSLVPLTGSLADVNIAMIRDNQPGEERLADKKRMSVSGITDGKGGKNKEVPTELELTTFHEGKDNIVMSIDQSASAATITAATTISAALTSSTASTLVPTSTSTGESGDGNDGTASTGSGSSDSFVLAEADGRIGDSSHDDAYTPQGKTEISGMGTDEVAKDRLLREGGDGDSTMQMEEVNLEQSDDHSRSKELSATAVSSSTPLVAASESKSNINQALQEIGEAFDSADGGLESKRQGEEEELDATRDSDPDTVDKINISSEGSDVAWELVSNDEDEGAEETENNANMGVKSS